jgi:replication-associated recombination protein RarA
MGYQLLTKRGYDFGEATSAMQKAIRRNIARVAGYFAIELFESGYVEYTWKRLLTISAEDCSGIITREIEALHQACTFVNKDTKRGEPAKGRQKAAMQITSRIWCMIGNRKCRMN